MTKENRNGLPHFQSFYDTYYAEDEKTALVRYQRYMNDPVRIMKCGGRQYYRIAAIWKVNFGHGNRLLCLMTIELSARIGDILIDELGNQYTLCGVEMLRYMTGYEFLAAIALPLLIEQADPSTPVGEYLSVYRN